MDTATVVTATGKTMMISFPVIVITMVIIVGVVRDGGVAGTVALLAHVRRGHKIVRADSKGRR